MRALVGLLVLASLAGCHDALSPKEASRAAVVSVASATRIMYDSCVQYTDHYEPIYATLPKPQQEKILAVAEKCDAVTQRAKVAVLLGADLVDSWDDKNKKKAACALLAATRDLSDMDLVLVENLRTSSEELAHALQVGLVVGQLYCGSK